MELCEAKTLGFWPRAEGRGALGAVHGAGESTASPAPLAVPKPISGVKSEKGYQEFVRLEIFNSLITRKVRRQLYN